ncbi:hypothetical protein DFP72DRAFT_867629 [Ephemerocybe angulata]|uniref:CBM1 domain-containing protein n=1 Tax=Ephemerocybe angulata TaxID=980116 RepID=A0A8H6MGV2_9AGAR|nr:hypothetical protein DFP72DRAFT_867629 [Tulosesus angulatus]
MCISNALFLVASLLRYVGIGAYACQYQPCKSDESSLWHPYTFTTSPQTGQCTGWVECVPLTTSGPGTITSAPIPRQTLYGQCGGIGYSGPTACAPGTLCNTINDFYSQCY